MRSNRSIPPATVIPVLHYDDVAAACARAVAFGGRVALPPTDHPYGERQCTIVDPGAHAWTLSQAIADVDPAAWGGVLHQQE